MKAEFLPPDFIQWLNEYIGVHNIDTFELACAVGVVHRSVKRRLNYRTKITLNEFFLIIDFLAASSRITSSDLLKQCLEATGKL